MNTLRLIPLASLLVILSSPIHGQDAKTSVILYNSQPVQVELSEAGKILTFYGLVKNYMEGYTLAAPVASIDARPAEVVEPTFTNASRNAEYDVISQERTTIGFTPGFATLSDQSIQQLNEIAARLKNSDYNKVIVTAYEADGHGRKVTENRVNSIFQYLSIKGLSRDQILTEVQTSNNLVDQLTINYVQ